VESLSTDSPKDALSEVLASIRFKSTLLCRSEMRAPWGFGVASRDFATFHIALKGGGWVEVEGVPGALRLETGDLVILPHGNAHAVRDDRRSVVTRLEQLVAGGAMDAHGTLHAGGKGPLTVMVCGGFHFEERSTSPLLLVLPPVIHVKGSRAPAWARTTMRLLKDESDRARPGSDLVVTRLADILFIEAVRAHLSSAEGKKSGLAVALADPRLGRALALIHRSPQASFSLERLAKEAGMSRTAFATRFHQLLGEAPARYGTRFRMNHAAGLLRAGDASLAQVAERVGYDSEVGFGRAFKRLVGTSPAAYRRSARS
jgi:AraC-like DNA-binding protein